MNNNEANDETTKRISKCSAIFAQVLAVSVKNIFLIGHGMTLTFSGILIPVLSGNDENDHFALGPEGVSWFSSISFICITLASSASGFLTQKLGRIRSIQLMCMPFIIGWLIYYFSKEVWHLFAALIISALAVGAVEAPIFTYPAEITEPYLRGILSSTSSMSMLIGSLIEFTLATFLNWREVALCCCIVPIISFFLLFLIPESPIWLIYKEKYSEAKENLSWLRGWTTIDYIEKEFVVLNDFVQKDKNLNGNESKIVTTFKLFKTTDFLKPFALANYLFFLFHFSGITPLQTFLINIFASLGTPIDKYEATVLFAISCIFGTLCFIILVNFIGKRVLAFMSLFGLTICFLILGFYSQYYDLNYLQKYVNTNETLNLNLENGNSNFSWVPLVIIVSSAFLAHLGVRVLPYIMTGEFFSNEIKPIASGLALASSCIFGFLCNKFFFDMIYYLNLYGTFYFYSLINLTGLIILYLYLPQTDGKILQEINDHFSTKSEPSLDEKFTVIEENKTIPDE